MAFKIADGYVEIHGRVNDASIKRATKAAASGFDDSGDRAGTAFSRAFTRALGRNTGGARTGFFGQLRKFFTPDRASISSLLHPLESALSIPIVMTIAAGIVSFGGGIIAAAISSAVLLGVGGVILGGAAALLGKKLKGSFVKATNTAVASLRRAAEPLAEPFRQAMRDIALLVQNMEGQFHAIFKAAAPIVPLLVETFAEFAKEILPTIGQIMPFVVDMFEVLAQRSPEIADAITKLLKAMADEETITAFNYLLTGLIGTIEFLAGAFSFLVRGFNKDIETWREGVLKAQGLMDNLKEAIGKIPGKKITKYLFQPGAALSWIIRSTNLVENIPKAWKTFYRFVGGGPAGAAAMLARFLVRKIPTAWRTAWRFISNLGPVKSVISWIARIPRNVTTTFTSVTRNITESITRGFGSLFGRASGGIIGAQGMATGGISGSRNVLVGEQGPEMVRLPFGSRVTPAGGTRAELARGGQGGGPITIHLSIGNRELGEIIVDPIRKAVRSRGGNVQAALGA